MGKILVTGSTGFLGRHVVNQLYKLSSDNVVTLSRSTQAHRYHHIVGDLVELSDWVDEIRRVRPSKIFHLAADTQSLDSGSLFERNTKSMNNLLTAVRPFVPKITLASTVAVYGQEANFKTIDESSATLAFGEYALSKLEQEKILQDYSRKTGKTCLSVRFSNLIGPGLPNRFFLGSLIEQVVLGLKMSKSQEKVFVKLGDTSASRDFIDVRDAATLLSRLAEKDKGGILLVGSGKETKLSTVVTIVQSILNSSVEIVQTSHPSSAIKRQRLDVTRYMEFMDSPQLIPLNKTIKEMINNVTDKFPT